MTTFAMEKIVIIVLAVIGFIILASAILGLNAGASFWYVGCDGDIGGKLYAGKGYASPRCTFVTEESACEISTYPNITREDMNISVCVWKSPEIIDGKNVGCFMNPEIGCADFSQTTTPRCQDVPDCQPVSALKAAVARLKPA